jgi:hypothetical protein
MREISDDYGRRVMSAMMGNRVHEYNPLAQVKVNLTEQYSASSTRELLTASFPQLKHSNYV